MNKFDLEDIEVEYDTISGTESAYVKEYSVTGKPIFRNDYGDQGCGSECDSCECKATKRKNTPVYSGVLMYFPDAIQAVARCSQAGNEQHHADKPLHWDRAKSTDEKDALARHLMQAGTIDDDGVRHSAKVAWRALANLQKELEAAGEAELSEYNAV